MIKKLTIIILFFILMAGCDEIGFSSNGRYSGSKDALGNYIILDTKTGNVKTIQNDQVINIPTEKEISVIKRYESKKFPGMPIEIIGLSIKYRDGRYHYRGAISPVIELKSESTASDKKTEEKEEEEKKARKNILEKFEGLWTGGGLYNTRQITVDLTDSDGFDITSFQITRGDLTGTVDHDGELLHYSFSGSKTISPKAYQDINNFTFSWNLEKWGTVKKK